MLKNSVLAEKYGGKIWKMNWIVNLQDHRLRIYIVEARR
jgi:hypothetical protein